MVFKLKVVDAPAHLFRIFYFVAKCNGQLPVTITFDPLTASNSTSDALYSILYTLILLVCILYAQSTIIEFIGILENPKQTIIFVFLTQVSCSALRVGTTYLSQIFNYKNFSRFINRSAQISVQFAKGNGQKSFLDVQLSKWCLSKFISMILQVFLIIVPSVGFILMIRGSDNFLLLLTCFIFILYTHMVLILSTGIYFSGMIAIGQFYKNLNGRINRLYKKFTVSNSHTTKGHVRMQQFCKWSDEFDELTVLYRDITSHSKMFSKYQRCFTFFSLTQYFVIILAEVCNPPSFKGVAGNE